MSIPSSLGLWSFGITAALALGCLLSQLFPLQAITIRAILPATVVSSPERWHCVAFAHNYEKLGHV